MSNHSNQQDFHHYKGPSLSPSEKVERLVAEMLIKPEVKDDNHESSAVWEMKHSSGCVQIARILAQKRGLDMSLAETASLLHDIYVIVHGKYADHAKLGAPIARKMLEQTGGFSKKQIDTIVRAVAHHSEKEIYSNDPYIELVKDVDVFDCSLYRGSYKYYYLHKPPKIVDHYIKRVKSVRSELGLSDEPVFRS